MIQFFLKSAARAVSLHRKWLLAALIPVVVYLGISAAIADRFVVRQDISITGDTLISLSPRAADVRSLKELVSTPSLFFQDPFALALLAKRLEMRLPSAGNRSMEVGLNDMVDRCLALDMMEKNILRIAYVGDNRKAGETMVDFYSQRLIKQAEDYLALNRSAVKSGAAIPRKIGRTTLSEKHSLWSHARLVPALLILLMALLFLVLLLALLEWFKPSFRSERQIAEYLGVPILGNFPDLNEIARDR